MNEKPIVPEEKSKIESDGQTQTFFSRALSLVKELAHVVLISLAIILPVRYFLIQPFYVKGASMEPNFYDHEYLIIDELSYRFNPPVRGDIVVFRYPNDPSQFFIKRIIGRPGEQVKVSGGKIFVNGTLLDESSYLGTLNTAGEKELTLKADEYYLLGDNRSASLDSRIFGPVSSQFLIGKVWFRGWPPERVKLFNQRNIYLGESSN